MATIELLDFSDEIFLDIFRNLSDVDLLSVAQVCKRFREIAKDTVAKKYNGHSKERYCNIRIYPGTGTETQEIYCQFFETFGNQIAALKIFTGIDKNNHLFKLIIKHCRFVKYVKMWGKYDKSWNPSSGCYEETDILVTETIGGMSHLRCLKLDIMACKDFLWTKHRYPQLERLELYYVRNMGAKALHQILVSNPQLQHLKVENCGHFKLRDIEVFRDNLNELKSLNFSVENNEFFHKCNDIKIENLKSLKITTDASSTANVLGAIGRESKNIQNMIVKAPSYRMNMDQTLAEFKGCIGLFDELTTLKLNGFEVGADLLQLLIQRLPNLTSLTMTGIHLRDVTVENILNAFRKGQRLKDLKLVRKELNNIRHSHSLIFNSDFHQKFGKIVRNRGRGIRFRFRQQQHGVKEKIIVTEEKIIKNGIVIYFAGYNELVNLSNVHLFDLNDRMLNKIFGYLDENAQRALYETCTKMRNSLRLYINLQCFTVSNVKTAEDTFKRFGEDITKLEIDMKTKNPLQMTETWKLIEKYCSKNLVEMSLNNVRVEATGSVPVEFPNLSEITVKTVISTIDHILPLMNCPKLAKLLFRRGTITLPSKKSQIEKRRQFGITLTNLKMIGLNYVQNNIGKILACFDDEISKQIEKFSVFGILKMKKGYKTKLATQFPNLTKLNYGYSLEESDFDYLFKNCTKLKTLSLYIDIDPPPKQIWKQILRSIKENCKHLEVLWLCAYEEHELEDCIPEAAAILSDIQIKIYCDRRGNLVGTYLNVSTPF